MNYSELLNNHTYLLLFLIASFVIGVSKTGIQGLGTLAVPIFAIIFGAKPSTGIILPILCFADLFGVIYYRRHCEWRLLIKLIPAAIIGFFIALAVDKFIPIQYFKILLASTLFIGIIIMIINEKTDANTLQKRLANSAYTFGIMGGFTTMIGNAAGPVMSVYLMLMKLPKYAFVGTSAWFFLIVNYLKLPLQAFVWNNITEQTLKISALSIVAVAIGAWTGIKLTNKLSEKWYKKLIIILTVISTLIMLI